MQTFRQLITSDYLDQTENTPSKQCQHHGEAVISMSHLIIYKSPLEDDKHLKSARQHHLLQPFIHNAEDDGQQT